MPQALRLSSILRTRLAALLPLLLLALGLSTPALAASPAPGVETAPAVRLLEGWRYRWGDGPLSPDGVPAWAAESGDGPEWRPVEALETPPGRDGQRLLWLSIPVPSGPWDAPALSLGSVNNVVEVYSGGRRIYAGGELNPTGYEKIDTSAGHVVPLPRGALGTRVLLRIQSSGASIGVRRDVRLGEYHALRMEAVGSGMSAFLLGGLLLVVALVSALACALRGLQRQLASLAVVAASTGLLAVGMSGVPSALWGASRPGYLVMLVGAYLSVPGLFSFVDAAVLVRRRAWLRRSVAVLYGLAALAALATVFVDGGLPRVFPVYLVLMVVSLLVCTWLSAVEALQGNTDARIFGAGMTGLFVSGVFTALASFGQLESMGLVIHWGLLALTLALVGIVARRASRVVRTLQEQTRTLEAQQAQVRRLAERMGSGAGELVAAVAQLRTAGEQQNAGISRQAAALQEAQTTVEEIRQTSQLTAEKAMGLAASAGEAEEIGQEGAQAIERTLAGLEVIRTEVGEMAQRITALEARNREIATIVDTVKGLADQSNMLALNAAIESTRAGEHGKGFGVVAREVRHLADQSIRATARIREVLEGINAGTREAARLGEQGEARVRTTLEEVRASGEQLRKLAAIVNETGASVRQMTAAVAQQDAGTHQIATAITDLSHQMERTLEALRETEAVTRSVHELAESMSGVAREVLPPARPVRERLAG